MLRRSGIPPAALVAARDRRHHLGDFSRQGWVVKSAASHHSEGMQWLKGMVLGDDGVFYVYEVEDSGLEWLISGSRRVWDIAEEPANDSTVRQVEPRFVVDLAAQVLEGRFEHADRSDFRRFATQRVAGIVASIGALLSLAALVVACLWFAG